MVLIVKNTLLSMIAAAGFDDGFSLRAAGQPIVRTASTVLGGRSQPAFVDRSVRGCEGCAMPGRSIAYARHRLTA